MARSGLLTRSRTPNPVSRLQFVYAERFGVEAVLCFADACSVEAMQSVIGTAYIREQSRLLDAVHAALCVRRDLVRHDVHIRHGLEE
eukprot:5566936-Pleurochrysis_carterae.AAC.3